MINFCHITPTKYLDTFTRTNGAHLILAHLVETDSEYTNFYSRITNKYKIMDNSAFEMFKQGKPMYESSKLIEMGERCKASCIVLSDYPAEDWTKTVQKAIDTYDEIKGHGFDTFFVPQSTLGDLKGYVESVRWALNNPKIDVIGLSILGCPVALGIDEKAHKKERSDSYKLQRFLSRYKILSILEEQGLLNEKARKRFHCLGMTDGPNEIMLLKRFETFIKSWDSSAAVWAGLNNITFDNSPTGLNGGKFEKEVDFNFYVEDAALYEKVVYNVNFIDRMVE